jgi:hypothetical protein
MTDADDAPALAGLDIFLPSPPPDAERQEAFLDEAAALAVLPPLCGVRPPVDDWVDRPGVEAW